MIPLPKPTDRLAYTGDLEPVFKQVCKVFGIGAYQSFSPIGVGYEDCNVMIQTDRGRFFAKMFAKDRTAEEIERYTTILVKVMENGIHHPPLLKTEAGESVYADSGIALVLMPFITGRTFYDLDQAPTAGEIETIIGETAKLHQIPHKPPYLFDIWAAPNIRTLFKRIKPRLEGKDIAMLERVLAAHADIPTKDLPHAFAHGDINKANVLKAETGQLYILDFSVANWYPRLHDLAVIAANLMFDPKTNPSLKDRCEQAASAYNSHLKEGH